MATGSGSTADEHPRFKLDDGEKRYREKMPQNYPEEGSEDYQELKRFASAVELILLTINEHEYRAAAVYMESPSDKFKRAVFVPGLGNRVVGMFARIKIALIQSEVGARSDEFIKDAIDAFPNAHFVIGVGVCYAFDRSKYQFGDVLVSRQICDMSDSKFSKQGKFEDRGETIDVAAELKRFCMDLISDFNVTENRISKVYCGRIVSIPNLIDYKLMKKRIKASIADVIGGEMEGGQLMKFQKKRKIKGVIIIKGVVDYADGSKSKDWQFTSAMAAVHYTYSKLQRIGTLSSGVPAAEAASSPKKQGAAAKAPKAMKLKSEKILCLCGLEAAQKTVKKDNENKGRLFYCCHKPQGTEGRCDFFQWCDDSGRQGVKRKLTITCSACGESGHNKRSRSCPSREQ